MNDRQKSTIIQILEGKKEEILNYDMGEPWAAETLDALQAAIDQLKKDTEL